MLGYFLNRKRDDDGLGRWGRNKVTALISGLLGAFFCSATFASTIGIPIQVFLLPTHKGDPVWSVIVDSINVTGEYGASVEGLEGCRLRASEKSPLSLGEDGSADLCRVEFPSTYSGTEYFMEIKLTFKEPISGTVKSCRVTPHVGAIYDFGKSYGRVGFVQQEPPCESVVIGDKTSPRIIIDFFN